MKWISPELVKVISSVLVKIVLYLTKYRKWKVKAHDYGGSSKGKGVRNYLGYLAYRTANEAMIDRLLKSLGGKTSHEAFDAA